MRSSKSRRLSVVLSKAEVEAFFDALPGTFPLLAGVQYGGGLRILEALRLRVKDVDIDRRQLLIRFGKGGKDRVVPLAERSVAPLVAHLEVRRRQYDDDCRQGGGLVVMPEALRRRCPADARSWGWPFVFGASRRTMWEG